MSTVADTPINLHSITLGHLESGMQRAHEHFITFGKVLDYSYEQDRKMVSLVQSLGVREVSSREVPAGPARGGP